MKKNVLVWLSSMLFPLFILAQNNPQPIINSTLSGTIVDYKTKTPLGGAVVKIKGTTHEVIADNDGKFHFVTGQKFPYILIVSFIR